MLDFLLGNDLLSALLAFAIVLIPAVIVHELGHFLAGRAVGITILEFGIGFPPRIAKLFTWRETEFTFNAIPLGGFVRPLGEDMIRPLNEEETERDREKLRTTQTEDQTENHSQEVYRSEREELAARGIQDARAVSEVKPLPRIFFMAAGALANFLFAYVVFIIIAMTGLPEAVGVRLGFSQVPANSAVAQLGLQQGDFIEQINGEYFQSRDEFVSILQGLESETATLQIRRTEASPDEVFTREVAVTPEFINYWGDVQPWVLITGVEENSPGDAANLQPDDYVVAFNGETFAGTMDPASVLVRLTNENAGSAVTLTLWRDGATREIDLVPRENPPPGSGSIGINIYGQYVDPETRISHVALRQDVAVPQPFGTAVNYATERTVSVFQMIAELPARLIGGNTQPGETRIVSIVAVSQLGGVVLQDSIEAEQSTPLLEYMALISIALGITNLLPIPALDGGRILFAVLELIRGKPIPPEREGLVHLAGMIFILSVGVLVIINDILNPITELIP